jgi:hypothetical protein
MPHNYRREGSERWRDERAERSDWNRDRLHGGRVHGDRLHGDRHRSRDDDRFSPYQEADFNQDRDSDRSYFAESSDSDWEAPRGRERSYRSLGGGQADRDQAWRRTQSYGDQYRNEAAPQRFDRGNRASERYGQRSDRESERGSRMLQWEDDRDDSQYFGTGNYHGAYSTGPAARASGSFSDEHRYLGSRNPMWRDEPQTWQEDDARSAGSTGSSQVYASSAYGSQGGFDRPYSDANARSPAHHGRGFGHDYREQFAEQRYGRQPAFGYGFTEGATGAFRGRGPKGYERSDDRLREIICERLTDDPRIDASDVHIEVRDKVAKLTGQVPDRRTKYEIEDVVEHCGVKDIDNQVRVRSKSDISPTSGTALGHQSTATDSSTASTNNATTRSKRN